MTLLDEVRQRAMQKLNVSDTWRNSLPFAELNMRCNWLLCMELIGNGLDSLSVACMFVCAWYKAETGRRTMLGLLQHDTHVS